MIDKTHFSQILLSLFASVCLITTSAKSEEIGLTQAQIKAIENTHHLKNPISEQSQDVFSKSSLVREFLSVAFSEDIWGTADGRVFSYNGTEKDPVKLQGIPEFISEYVIREKGFPKLGVINKWDHKDIKIGFGWPTSEFAKWNKDIEVQQKYYNQISQMVRQESEKVNKIGVVNLEFIDPETEKVKGYADIRVIPFQRPSGGVYPRFKANDFHNDSRIWYLENFIKAGVRFSEGNLNQVEGYLLTDASNSIKQAVCYINMDMNSQSLESYIDECLFRSLGLTGSANYTGGILSVRKDGELTKIDEKDAKLLSTLYDTRVSAGDDKYAVINRLSN